MKKIYFDKPEIPIPEGAHISKTRGDVFIFLPRPDEKLSNSTKRLTIGRATSENMMYPNDNYKNMYPKLWAKFYSEAAKQTELRLNAGMYQLTLGIGHKYNLYPLLYEAQGPLYGNAIIDYAMYLNLPKTDADTFFEGRMKKEIIFSKDRISHSWISDLLSNKMNYNTNMRFMDLWVKNCRQMGETEAWISMESTNDDDSSSSKAKTTSYIYVISAKTGLPLFVSLVIKGLTLEILVKDAIGFMINRGISVKGIIINKGFCTKEGIEVLEKLGYPYIMILKTNTHAYTEMFNKYSKAIKWNPEYIIEDENVTLFGCTSQNKQKIFSNSDSKAFINLFFDGSSTYSIGALNSEIISTKEQIMKMMENGEEIVIPETMTRYIGLNDDGPYYKKENWKEDLATEGFCAFATSENVSLSKIREYYAMRDSIEAMSSETKKFLRYTHSNSDVLENKLFICYIATIMRSYIMQACKELQLRPDEMLAELDSIQIKLNDAASESYNAIHNETQSLQELLEYFSIQIGDLDAIAEDVSARNKVLVTQFRRLKSFEDAKLKAQKEALESQDDKNSEKPKRAPGRPKGAKSKSTLEREAETASGEIAPKEKGKPGRPKGSLNKKTLLMRAKHRKGRPPGSKNKATIEREQQEALQAKELAVAEKGKAGRPKGSKDKEPSTKRKGRTPGSRNKTKVAEDQLLTSLIDNYHPEKDSE